jgi:hypothetical protein
LSVSISSECKPNLTTVQQRSNAFAILSITAGEASACQAASTMHEIHSAAAAAAAAQQEEEACVGSGPAMQCISSSQQLPINEDQGSAAKAPTTLVRYKIH